MRELHRSKNCVFVIIQAKNCHVAAAFFYGLPEQKIERVEMKHIQVSYAEDAASGQPAMMDGIDQNICKMGIFARKYQNSGTGGYSGGRTRGEVISMDGIDSLEWRK